MRLDQDTVVSASITVERLPIQPSIVAPEFTLETGSAKFEKITDDRGVEQRIQEIVVQVESGNLDPAEALQQIATVNNIVTTYGDWLPADIEMSKLRRKTVLAQAQAHLLAAVADTPNMGGMYLDTRNTIKRALAHAKRQTITTIPFDSSSTIAGIHFIDPNHRDATVHAIDHYLFIHTLEELETSVVTAARSKKASDWEIVTSRPLSVEQSNEKLIDIQKNPPHIQAERLIAEAERKRVSSPDEYVSLLSGACDEATEALRGYNAEEAPDEIAVAACRLLYAKALHDRASLKNFKDERAGDLSARRVSIELLWEASDGLLATNKELDSLLDSPRPMTDYSEEELWKLRSAILSTGKYLSSIRMMDEIEYLRGQYTEQIGRNPNVHYRLDPEDVIFVRSFGRRATGTVVEQPNDTEPVQPADEHLVEAA